jgi:hypothetical protein
VLSDRATRRTTSGVRRLPRVGPMVGLGGHARRSLRHGVRRFDTTRALGLREESWTTAVRAGEAGKRGRSMWWRDGLRERWLSDKLAIGYLSFTAKRDHSRLSYCDGFGSACRLRLRSDLLSSWIWR